jgi:hypothetical protein
MPIPAPPHVQDLLHRVHERSLGQERVLAEEGMGKADFETYMRDKFIALEQDKCEFVYTLARALTGCLLGIRGLKGLTIRPGRASA